MNAPYAGQPLCSDVPPRPNRVVRTVLVADMVESVRLMDRAEDEVVERWESLVRHVEEAVLPAHDGRLVKSLGDGFILDFSGARDGLRAAFEIQALLRARNATVSPEQQMLLRVGIHTTDLIAGHYDVYGRGVNLVVRLATLAGPGEVVVSGEVRDHLTAMLDATFHDLGECYLKHVPDPVRAFRAEPPGAHRRAKPEGAGPPALHPTVAVIPFTAHSLDPDQQVLGEVLAEDIIASISRAPQLAVISRLSTTSLRGRSEPLVDAYTYLNATYVLSGTYRTDGARLSIFAELAEARTRRVVWSHTYRAPLSGILHDEGAVVGQIVEAVGQAVNAHEIRRASVQPLPTLECSTLLMGAIASMHRGSPADFQRARDMLEAVIDRARLVAAPYAWLAKWHVLGFNRGWAPDQKHAAQHALDQINRALDLDPNCSLALVIDGFIHTNLLRRLDVAHDRYDRALALNRSDSLAWLLKGMLHGFQGEGAEAVHSTERAIGLSPLDPLMYFYQSLAASAALIAGRYDRAVELAQSSLQLNRTHTSTLRALAMAQSLMGRMDEARTTVREILIIEPTLTVARYLARSPAAAPVAARLGEALRAAGVPA